MNVVFWFSILIKSLKTHEFSHVNQVHHISSYNIFMVVSSTLYCKSYIDCNMKDTSLRCGKQHALTRGVETDYDTNGACICRGITVSYNKGNEKRVKSVLFFVLVRHNSTVVCKQPKVSRTIQTCLTQLTIARDFLNH
jgi:hypothetical protein